MPDEPPVSETGTQSRRPLNVNEANVGNVRVTRMDVNTGEIKELQTDLLDEICECIKEQTKQLGITFSQELRSAKNDLIRALQAGGGGAGGGGAGGGGAGGGGAGGRDETEKRKKTFNDQIDALIQSMQIAAEQQSINVQTENEATQTRGRGIAEVRELNRALSDFDKAIKETTPGIERAGKLLQSGFKRQTQQLFESFWLDIQTAGASLRDFNKQLENARIVAKKLTDTFDIAQTGIADTSELLIDSFKQAGRLIRGIVTQDFEGLRDSIRRTSEFILEQAEGRPTQLLLEGTRNIEDAAKFLRDTRNTIQEDFNFRRFMSDEEANQAILELLEVQRRAGIQQDLNVSSTAKRFVEQNTFLARIAQDTGLSLEQLRKMSEDNRRQLANLKAIGALNDEQLTAFTEVETVLGALKATEFNQIVNQLAQAGNNFELFAGRFPDTFRDLAIMGISEPMRELTDLINQRDELGQQEFMDRFTELNSIINQTVESQRGNLEALAAAGEISQNAISLAGEVALIPKRLQEIDTTKLLAGTTKSFWERGRDLFRQFFPANELGLVRALAANTAAVIANTAALLSGPIAGIFRRLFGRGGPPGPRRNMNLLRRGRPIGGGGAAGGAGAAGRAGAGAATRGLGLLGKGGLLGAAGLAGFSAARATGLDEFLNESVVSGEGTIGTAIAGLLGADKTDPKIKSKMDAEVARLKAAHEERKRRRAAMATTTGATVAGAPKPTPTGDPTVDHMAMQTEKLTSIESLLSTANGLHTQIRDTIGAAGALSRVGDTSGPSPVQRKVPALAKDVQPFESYISVDSSR